ncbi:uncharacterized protein LOC113290646 [Papaver somniferum]|uniref:uncharacterized protein LOC113290646 n=1 Tax=Papaver somniferum TaxID=3469 RepID=UPI000E701D0C|nr:uncharacterized protein LOC113290646 [Papaver somniferum]
MATPNIRVHITCAPPKTIKWKAVADLLAAFPGEGTTALHEDLPGEFPEISFIKEEAWILYFDGSATLSNNTGGASIVLVSPTCEVFSHSFKLDFQCTNNSAEYEAFLIVLSLAKQAGATHLEVRGDSKLLVNQMNGVYPLKEVTLAPYRSEAQKLLKYFADATITHIGRNNNKHADFLATLASMLQFEGLEETLIMRRQTVASTWLAQSKDAETDDWRTQIIQELNSSLSQGKVRELLEEYGIKQVLSTIYYPQGNGQAESTNKTLIRILSRTVHDHPRTWHEQLPMALWAYPTTPRSSTCVSPYSLFYGADAILLAEIKIPSTRIVAASGVHWNEAEALSSIIAELDTLDSWR